MDPKMNSGNLSSLISSVSCLSARNEDDVAKQDGAKDRHVSGPTVCLT